MNENKKKASLTTLIARYVLPATLAKIVTDDGVMTNLEEIHKLALGTPDPNLTLARSVVEAYAAAGKLDLLATRVMRDMRDSDVFMDAMAHAIDEQREPGELEAANAKRARTLYSRDLRRFLDDQEPKICVVAAVAKLRNGAIKFNTGTGFLLSEDLVLTARHVLKDHIEGGQARDPSPGPLYAFFDHLKGSAIKDPRDPKIKARRVEFHPDSWLQDLSDYVVDDGALPDPLTPERICLLQKSLDIVLIKLAEPVGAYTRRAGGGERRGWIRLPEEHIPSSLQEDDRILIPQHPQGEIQQIDFGRYKTTDASGTRIRYDTETDPGTSGAPCFNQYFQLVGMHNAAINWRDESRADEERPDKSKLNQAVRFDHILRRIRGKIQPRDLPPPSRLWSVAEDPEKPEVIIGREKLLDWLQTAVGNNPNSIKQRVYAAEASGPRCGKSFSLQVLQAALGHKATEPVVVMGTRQQAMPTNADDFMASFADQLKIPPSELQIRPKRPDGNLPPGSPDGDKTNLWLSRDVPAWLNDLLRRHRQKTIDLRDRAHAQVKRFTDAGLAPRPADIELANLPDPQPELQSRWERIWIVLDNFNSARTNGEMRELLSGLIGMRVDEAAFFEELRCIRWLFLGSLPEFLAGFQEERLDQMALTIDDIARCIEAMAVSINRQASEKVIEEAASFVKVSLYHPAERRLYEDPSTRLSYLQQTIVKSHGFLKAFLAGDVK